MQWESPNEKHAFTHLDFRYDILAYREQACEIVFIDDEGQEVAHYPDVDVLAITGHEIWEVKPERYANSRLVSRRTEIISEALVTFGITYRMAVAEELRMQPRLKTMDKVLGFGNRPVSNAERASVARELIQSGRLTWGDACSGRFGSNGREILCRLVLEGFLQIDVDCLFGTATEFVTGNRSW